MTTKPETVEELCDWIEAYMDDIYVREQINEKWGSHALSALPTKVALGHTLRWIREGIVPTRIRR